jgi:mevalonate kinase
VGHGKLLLFGEHAAVHGHPAVGLSLDETTVVELSLDGRPGWRFPGLEAERRGGQEERLGRMLSRLHELARGPGPGGGEARFTSDIPPALGFGSSAALCAAAAAALGAGYGAAGSIGTGSESAGSAGAEPAGTAQLWAWAHEAERFFHGTPSGIDTGLALLDGLYLFQPAPPGLPSARRLPGLPLHLVVGAVPRHGDTGTLVAGLGGRVSRGDRRAVETLRELGRIAGRAAELLSRGGAGQRRQAALGKLANAAQALLAGQGLSTAELDGLLRRGLSGGALGGKLSGAGGGGAFYLICPGADSAARIAGRLRAAAREAGLPTAGTIRALSYWPCSPVSRT